MLSRNLIGFVGQPGHGKSTAIRVAQRLFGAVAFDTGAPLRRGCMDRYGLSWNDVFTQEGKLRMVRRPERGDVVTVRQALGDFGKEIEATSPDKNIWTTIAVDDALQTLFPLIVFDSVRMGQGEVIQRAGGFVIEIVDPRKPSSSHDFDQYDPRFVNCRVTNNGSIEKFEQDVEIALLWAMLTDAQRAAWEASAKAA
jgi:hypothetical protein